MQDYTTLNAAGAWSSSERRFSSYPKASIVVKKQEKLLILFAKNEN